jgi:lactoylglutathione lyase
MKYIVLVISLILYPICSNGQSYNLEHDHSTIQVENIDKSVKFYIDILKLKEMDTPWPENPMIRFFKTGNNQQLHIAQVDTYGTVKTNKVLHLAFSTNNFDGYLKFLNVQGISYYNFNEEQNKIQKRPDGVRQIYFQDPDGYWIEINDANHL